jgi:alpha-D-xyloside xylohydrolase
VDRLQRQSDALQWSDDVTAAAPLDVIPRYVKAGSIIPRGDILRGNNNWTPNWGPSLDIEFFPVAGVTSRFNYYTGMGVVPMFGYISNHTVFFKFNSLGTNGNVEMYQ